jgi:hypothetical protein
MWKAQDTRPASADERYEASTISETGSSIRSLVGGSEGDGLSVHGDDYETPMSSFADENHHAHASPKPASLELVEQRGESLREEVPVALATGRHRRGPMRLRSIGAKLHED